MEDTITLENIEEMRRLQGIDDDVLRRSVLALRVGDLARLTFLVGPKAPMGETLAVQITSITGDTFHAQVMEKPASARLAGVAGARVRFQADHVHSIPVPHPPGRRQAAVAKKT